MNIYGDKIVLRAIEIDDTDMLLEIINDPETEKNLGGSSFPVSRRMQEKWIEALGQNSEILRCVIVHKMDTKKGLGTVILSDINRQNGVAEIHIKLTREARGQGLGIDAINAMMKYAFQEQRLNCITANVLSYNVASQKLFEKCGFKKEGILRQRVYKGGRYIDIYSYSVLREEHHDV